jgi:alpha-D-xyloside xylohydrolase
MKNWGQLIVDEDGMHMILRTKPIGAMKRSFFLFLVLVFSLAWARGEDSVQKIDHGILVVSDSVVVKIQPWSARTVRVEAAPGTTVPAKTSMAVFGVPNPVGWKVAEDATTVQLTGKYLHVVVNKQNGLVSFFDADGKLLLGQKSWLFKPARNATRDGLEIGATFVRQPDEHLFGGGVIGDDLRQPQTDIPLENDYLQMHIPILYSSLGYGIFWDNASRGKLSTTPDSVTWQATAGDLADFYVMAGPQADDMVAEYRRLTGVAPMFPKWAYGFWFSRNAFHSQQEILDSAKKFREEQIPIDLLVQDYFYWKPDNSQDGAAGWGSHRFDPTRYPNPKGMIDTLHDQDHIHFMAVIWPKLNPDTANYRELDKAGGLFPSHGYDWVSPRMRFYDPFDPVARKIYGRQVMDSLLPLGQDAFWMDGAEPEMDLDKFASFDSPAGPVSRIMDAFPLMHTTAIYQAQRAVTSDKRVVLLPRSAWAGEQRNAACAWTSDIQQSWHDFTWQIEGLQNYSICGLPYITTDVGGYNPTPESDRELFVRWVEWGTFCPIFRVHGVDRPFPWDYGNEGETIIKKFDLLRYRLLPYIYSQAAQVTFDSGTIMRPLVMDFRNDPRAVTQWDEFMFGPSILVCPVYQCSRDSVGMVDDFADQDGKTGGVTAIYIKPDGQQVTARKDLRDGLQFTQGATGDQRGQSSIRFEGTFTPKTDGPLAFQVDEPHAGGYPVTGNLNGQPIQSNPLNGDWQFPLFPFQAQAGVPVHFSLETKMWDPAFQVVRESPMQRNVYLPGKGDWYDFWTGERRVSGQTSKVATPLDMIPLYVRAGTILPMGPVIQYASEKAADPIELRVYRGADGFFKLYEDEGDDYNYEKGVYSEIPITWNESRQILTIGKRKGSFPGMLTKRTFDVIWVGEGHGVGEQVTEKIDAEVSYHGRTVTIKAPRR